MSFTWNSEYHGFFGNGFFDTKEEAIKEAKRFCKPVLEMESYTITEYPDETPDETVERLNKIGG
jgi:hypothetical protein